MINMKMSSKGKAFLTCREGICLTPYLDSVGVKTIAIGATKTEIPDLASWPWDRKITLPQAFALMNHSLLKYEIPINKYITKPIPQYMFDALVSWCYNVGVGWIPKASVIKFINAGADKVVISRALLMYNHPPEIIGRRKKEASLLVNGDYGDLTKADLFSTNARHRPIYGKNTINPMNYITEDKKEAVIVNDDPIENKQIIAHNEQVDDLTFIKDKIGEINSLDLDWIKIAKEGLGIG